MYMRGDFYNSVTATSRFNLQKPKQLPLVHGVLYCTQKAWGTLNKISIEIPNKCCNTMNLSIPLPYSPEGSMVRPFLSTAGEISKVARTEAMVMNSDEVANFLPGHILLPNPQTASGSFTAGLSLPSAVKKRSGLKMWGSGYTTGSCSIALVG